MVTQTPKKASFCTVHNKCLYEPVLAVYRVCIRSDTILEFQIEKKWAFNGVSVISQQVSIHTAV